MLSRLEHFIYDLAEIDLYWHRLSSDVMRSYGLRGNQAVYFIKLREHPEGINAARLCRECSKDKGEVSRDIKQLEAEGLISRINNGKTAYRASIVLTERGREITDKIAETAQTAVECVGRNLSSAERETMYKALDDIANNMRELSEKGTL